MSLISRGSAPLPADATPINVIDGLAVYNSSYTGIKPMDIIPRDPDYAYERYRAINFNTNDGVLPMTKEEQAYEREVSWRIVKEMTMKIFSMDLTRFSFPVAYSEERSFLERTADLFSFLSSIYIEKARQSTAPVTRLQMLATGVIAGFHLYLQSKKPWNPVLGETFFGRWPNGTTIYGEQTSHHPPVSDFQIYGPNNEWKCHAQCRFTISSGLFQVDVIQKGVFKLEFDDGTKYEWEFPSITVVGLIRGDRIVRVKGPFCMYDKTNDLECKVDIAPKANKSIGLPKTRQTTIYGGVKRANEKEFISTMVGDYTDKITSGGVTLWDINTDFATRALEPVADDELLLSDCRFRLDRAYLIRKNSELADLAKTTIEDAQRRDKKLRESA